MFLKEVLLCKNICVAQTVVMIYMVLNIFLIWLMLITIQILHFLLTAHFSKHVLNLYKVFLVPFAKKVAIGQPFNQLKPIKKAA